MLTSDQGGLEMTGWSFRISRRAAATALAAASLAAMMPAANAADPIKVGFSMALTGGVAQNGKQLEMALQIWRDDINAKGGLLGRPIELVYYDDQSNPANVPGIYTKLITVDKVDLVLGPYATNMVAPAMPVIMQHNKMTVSMLAVSVNRHFNYPKYFSMVPIGQDGVRSFSKGFFDLAAAQKPKPQTVAIVAADAEFARTSADGAKENAKAAGFRIIYERGYPPNNTDFAPIMRAVQAANPDLVFVAAYPPDSVGIVRAADEIGLKPKMFGGTMIGLIITPIKMQLGPLMNGMVVMESFLPAPSLQFPGLSALMAEYRKRAAGQRIDPFGYGFVPFGYAAGQVLAAAVTETKSLDHEKLAAYVRKAKIPTVVGDIAYGADGEWANGRMLFTQYQGVTKDGGVDQFADTTKEPILWPESYKTGNLIYPYEKAKQ
jgi:branched-chain amino acid transport system substrate-binding protein